MELRPHLKSFRDWIKQFFFGLFIGASDLVPGFSGGTMALILGIYEELIFSVRSLGSKGMLSLFRLDFHTFSRAVCWDFLLGLIMGASVAILTLSQLINVMLSDPSYRQLLYAIFLGMITASFCVYWKRFKNWQHWYWISLGVGIAAAFVLTGPLPAPASHEKQFDVQLPVTIANTLGEQKIKNYSSSDRMLHGVYRNQLDVMFQKGNITFDTPVLEHPAEKMGKAGEFVEPISMSHLSPWLILCGAMAISAMLLPGVSGSYVLHMVGVYPIAIGALVDFTRHGNVDAFFILFNLMIGIVIGAPLVSKVIGWLLNHYHDATLALLLGFMIGALHTVWPFYTYEYNLLPLRLEKGPQLDLLQPYLPSLDSSMTYYVGLLTLAGFLAVIALEKLASNLKKGQTQR